MPEIACIQGYRIRTHEVQQPVIAPCGKLLCGSLSLAVHSLAVGIADARAEAARIMENAKSEAELEKMLFFLLLLWALWRQAGAFSI